MSDDENDDNVVQLGVKPQDRVLTLADEVCKTLTRFYSVHNPEEHLAALYLAEAAVQHIVVTRHGPAGLNTILRRANEIRRSYGFSMIVEKTIYDEDEQPADAPVIELFRKPPDKT